MGGVYTPVTDLCAFPFRSPLKFETTTPSSPQRHIPVSSPSSGRPSWAPVGWRVPRNDSESRCDPAGQTKRSALAFVGAGPRACPHRRGTALPCPHSSPSPRPSPWQGEGGSGKSPLPSGEWDRVRGAAGRGACGPTAVRARSVRGRIGGRELSGSRCALSDATYSTLTPALSRQGRGGSEPPPHLLAATRRGALSFSPLPSGERDRVRGATGRGACGPTAVRAPSVRGCTCGRGLSGSRCVPSEAVCITLTPALSLAGRGGQRGAAPVLGGRAGGSAGRDGSESRCVPVGRRGQTPCL